MIDVSDIGHWASLDPIVQVMWWFIPTVIFAALWIIGAKLDSELLMVVFALLTVMYGVFGGIAFMLGMPTDARQVEAQNRVISYLTEEGYTDIKLDEKNITASNQGEYFRGLLVEIDTDIWEVKEVVSR